MKQNHSREFDQKREPALHYPKEAKNIVDQILDDLQKAGEDLSPRFSPTSQG